MLCKTFITIASICALLLPASVVVPRVTAEGSTVVINELMWMGSSASSADEWIELRNVTDQTVDLSNWTLTKKSSGVEVPMLTIPSGKNILPGGIVVISNYANTNANSALNVVPDVVTTDVALSNSALQIKLYDPTQKLIDVADDGAGNPLAGAFDSAKKVYASMERNLVPGDGTLVSSWHTASSGLGFKTGAIELGTPGTTNSNGVPTAHAGSDQSGTVGLELNFDGSDSVDPEGQPLTYGWNFGDGITGLEATPKHAYAAAGEFTVTLTVSDGLSAAADTVKVKISAAPAALAPPIPPITTTTTPISPTPVATEEKNPPIATASCFGLRLSELYPNPPGVDNDEFIEVVNSGDEEITTGVCAVFTTATRSYKIPAGIVVARGAFLLLPKSQTHLTLNNGGTTVRLVDSDGTELDRAVYATSPEGASWARVGETWSWTAQPTPNAANVAVAPTLTTTEKKSTTKSTTKKSTKSAAAKKTKKVEAPAQAVTLKQVQELDSSDRVMIQGVVTVPRDALGSTLAYLQTNDGGVSISIPNGEKSIELGQTIEVTGTVRLKNGRRYVAVAAKSLKVVQSAPLPTPPSVPTDDVGADQADELVHVKGVVSLASGNRIEVDDGSGPVPIYIKSSTGIVRPKVKAGDTVDAVGIVGVSTSGIRILPRAQSDIHVERVLGAATVAPTQAITPPAASRGQTLWYWGFVVLGALVAGVRPMRKAWRKYRFKIKD